MERVGPGEMLSATFQFMRDHLKAIAIWSAIYFAMGYLAQLLMRPYYEMQLGGIGGSPNLPAQSALAIIGGALLLFAMMVVLNAAIFRAALYPERQELSYIRIGMDELRLFGLLFFLSIAFFIGFFIVTLVVELLVIGLIMAGGATRILGVLLAIIGVFVILGTMIYFVVRLSSAGPLTILRKKITIGEAWRVTRGNFWSLFGTYAVVAVVSLIAFSVVIKLTLGGEMWTAMMEQMRHPGDPLYQQQMMSAQMHQMYDLDIAHVVSKVIVAVLYMATVSLICGSIAAATRLLVKEDTPASVF